jgi:hypothetical protein
LEEKENLMATHIQYKDPIASFFEKLPGILLQKRRIDYIESEGRLDRMRQTAKDIEEQKRYTDEQMRQIEQNKKIFHNQAVQNDYAVLSTLSDFGLKGDAFAAVLGEKNWETEEGGDLASSGIEMSRAYQLDQDYINYSVKRNYNDPTLTLERLHTALAIPSINENQRRIIEDKILKKEGAGLQQKVLDVFTSSGIPAGDPLYRMVNIDPRLAIPGIDEYIKRERPETMDIASIVSLAGIVQEEIDTFLGIPIGDLNPKQKDQLETAVKTQNRLQAVMDDVLKATEERLGIEKEVVSPLSSLTPNQITGLKTYLEGEGVGTTDDFLILALETHTFEFDDRGDVKSATPIKMKPPKKEKKPEPKEEKELDQAEALAKLIAESEGIPWPTDQVEWLFKQIGLR